MYASGFDEVIKIYDIRKNKEVGLFENHVGSINAIGSFQNFIFSASDDGMICIWKQKEWSLVHSLKGHKGKVIDIAVHSTGKILVSIDNHNKLMIWNLLNAERVYERRMKF